MRRIVVVGAGGAGRSTADLIDRINSSRPTWNLVGFLDDDPRHDPLGPLRLLMELDVDAYTIAIADPAVRRGVDTDRLEAATLIDPQSVWSTTSTHGPGLTVRSNVSVDPDVAVGSGAMVTRDVPDATVFAGAPAQAMH